jgi:hypothetical protein
MLLLLLRGGQGMEEQWSTLFITLSLALPHTFARLSQSFFRQLAGDACVYCVVIKVYSGVVRVVVVVVGKIEKDFF